MQWPIILSISSVASVDVLLNIWLIKVNTFAKYFQHCKLVPDRKPHILKNSWASRAHRNGIWYNNFMLNIIHKMMGCQSCFFQKLAVPLPCFDLHFVCCIDYPVCSPAHTFLQFFLLNCVAKNLKVSCQYIPIQLLETLPPLNSELYPAIVLEQMIMQVWITGSVSLIIWESEEFTC